MDHHPFVKRFKKECNELIHMIYTNNPDLKKVVKAAKEVSKEYKLKNRVASYFYQIIENHLIYVMYNWLVNEGVVKKRFCGLEYDGLCFPPAKAVDFDALIPRLNAHILKKTGMAITFKYKKYDESTIMMKLINKRTIMKMDEDEKKGQTGEDEVEEEEEEEENEEGWRRKKARVDDYDEDGDGGKLLDNDDAGAAAIVFKNYPHWKLCSKTLWVFDDEVGMWFESDPDRQNKIISRFSEKLNTYRLTKDGYVLSGNYARSNNKRKDIIPYLRELCIDDKWLRHNERTSLGKIQYTNSER
jgi:hypothetical protein